MDDVGFFNEDRVKRGNESMRNGVQMFGAQGRHENFAHIILIDAIGAIPTSAIDGNVHAGTRQLRRQFVDVALDPAKNSRNAFLSDHDDFHSL